MTYHQLLLHKYDVSLRSLTSSGIDIRIRKHMSEVHEILVRWLQPPDVCLAGYFYAIYGTQDFPYCYVPISERPNVKKILGDAAEEIIYQYSLDQHSNLFIIAAVFVALAESVDNRYKLYFLWLLETDLPLSILEEIRQYFPERTVHYV